MERTETQDDNGKQSQGGLKGQIQSARRLFGAAHAPMVAWTDGNVHSLRRLTQYQVLGWQDNAQTIPYASRVWRLHLAKRYDYTGSFRGAR
jgi:hypothetical protein